MNTVNEIFDAMPASFRPEAAAGLEVVYQFDITGEGGGQWYAAIKDGTLALQAGRHSSPSATITARAEDYLAVANGQANEMMAFATGKLRVKGSIVLAMKLNKIFRRK
ncbi:MAG: SCP2 sterol-binding domain-containing protein [Deltaproteobacteria bacterium]|nr:SCP2 sterol-binding domain-containing protein [Deltaproteobacteria bacterium]